MAEKKPVWKAVVIQIEFGRLSAWVEEEYEGPRPWTWNTSTGFTGRSRTEEEAKRDALLTLANDSAAVRNFLKREKKVER